MRTPPPRELTFVSLDQVMPEVDDLLMGHLTLGNWSLGQICNHLASAIRITVEGPPERAPWLVRKTVGPLIFKRILKTRRWPAGIKLPNKYEPKPGSEARAEAEALRAALQLLASHPGPLAEHPFAGPISRAAWECFHSIHCAHHLSFARPIERKRGKTPRDPERSGVDALP